MKFGKVPIFSHKISDGKKGGPLPKINNGRGKSKSGVSSQGIKKKGPQTPGINNNSGKRIEVSALNNKSNFVTFSELSQRDMYNNSSMVCTMSLFIPNILYLSSFVSDSIISSFICFFLLLNKIALEYFS